MQHMEGHMDLIHTGGVPHAPLQPLVVGQRVVQRGLFQRDHPRGYRRISHDPGRLEAMLYVVKGVTDGGVIQIGGADTVLEGGGGVRDLHHGVAGDGAAAGQPPALGEIILGDVAGGGGVGLTLQQPEAAFAAGAVSGAGGVNGDAGPAGYVQQVFPIPDRGDQMIAVFKLKGDVRHIL